MTGTFQWVYFLYPRKARHLPRPWPLLTDKQSPEALEARVAFHLHRLAVRGRRLADALGEHGTHQATALAQGRTALNAQSVRELTMLLGFEDGELTRPLTDHEAREWHFYRVSARNAPLVWSNARAAWSSAEYTNKHASEVMCLSHYHVRNNIRRHNDTPSPLTFPPAVKLSTALSLPLGTNHFLPELQRFSGVTVRSVTD